MFKINPNIMFYLLDVSHKGIMVIFFQYNANIWSNYHDNTTSIVTIGSTRLYFIYTKNLIDYVQYFYNQRTTISNTAYFILMHSIIYHKFY